MTDRADGEEVCFATLHFLLEGVKSTGAGPGVLLGGQVMSCLGKNVRVK